MRALIIAAAISLVLALVLTPLFAKLSRRLELGQFIREDGPKSHYAKHGTPTMGGIVIIVAAIAGFFGAALITGGDGVSAASLLVLLMLVGNGLVGFVDDFIKVRRQRSLGLGGWAKIGGQVVVATAFGLLAINFPDDHGHTPASTAVSFIRDLPGVDLLVWGGIPAVGIILYLVWINLISASTTNGVNVTDGLDGLATGASILAIGAYLLIGFWQYNESCYNPRLESANVAACYQVSTPLNLAVVAAAIVGALVGFLWWNTNPAKIIMGDTGSLGLGGALAALAVESHTELLLVIIGALFVIEPGSVIIQRAYFKFTHGKRIFRMSPIHHHFELKGWAEVTVVVRFWIIAGLFAAIGVGAFYLEWSLRAP
ncbi:phospho-N-acetylmuramoyl-pentapeptide-transferase [Gryllotalpicola sp.]|uniref:phospho-N-acetylmuramoyl-pentapeptide- transferase n=1 Tax=Gryllotalpicola sp. TaxID=1932787 RepID=UPI002610E623|nr:phospho-N-acetylmuramoyl-pentapeptide-transferase [Gryllotalpicola sp.]